MFDELRRIGIEFDVDLAVRIGSLILARFLGAALSIPFLGGQLIPGRIKFGIPLVFSVFLYPFVSVMVDPKAVPALGMALVALIMKELFIGYALGFIVSLPFYAVETAGSFMDTQRGTTFAQVLAPLLGGQTSLLAQLYLLLFISIFLGLGGNHLVIGALGESFRVVGILEWPRAIEPNSPFVDAVISHAADIFRIGLTLSAPVVIAMLLTDVTLGVVNRTAPNIQVFWLGMPIKTLAGLMVVFFAIGYASDIFAELTVNTGVAMKRAMLLLAAGGAR
jgi:flagellar biosynthetic protein FliR